MELFHSSDVNIDAGVLARLKRLDKNLRVTFSHFAINEVTSVPMVINDWGEEEAPFIVRRGGTAFLHDPAFHVWVREEGSGRFHLVMTYPAANGFGHREVQKLEADVARYMSPTEILRKHRELREAAEAKEKQDNEELRSDILKANQSRIGDLVFGGKHGHRDAKIVSYPGQGNRGSRGQVKKDDKEDGWEKPESS
jgi:hypothetical protein